MSRTRRKPAKPGIAHYAAPVAFLAAVTIAVLLVHSALNGRHTTSTTTTAPPVVSVTGSTLPSKPAKRTFYVVQSGDTFGTIAAKAGISVAQLQSLNPGVSSNALQVGQKLRVK